MTVRWMIPNSNSGAGWLAVPFSEAGNTGGGRGRGRGMVRVGGDGLRFGHDEPPSQIGRRSRQVPGSGALARGLERRTSRDASTAGAPGVEELAQESRWQGRVPGLGNRHI